MRDGEVLMTMNLLGESARSGQSVGVGVEESSAGGMR